VLGTPPAFVLSQDQTLQKELSHAQNVTLASDPKITILLFVDACLFSFQRAIFYRVAQRRLFKYNMLFNLCQQLFLTLSLPSSNVF
ncbi:hypothetical protein, partial [Bacillus sp. FJAT-27245]|uniref:hypothetical protein n=1 Tax=Bacillus sp. FJAT-27245 TaxID=1684144 RepID=UPI001E52A367